MDEALRDPKEPPRLPRTWRSSAVLDDPTEEFLRQWLVDSESTIKAAYEQFSADR